MVCSKFTTGLHTQLGANTPTKITLSPILSLFSPIGVSFFAKWGRLFASLYVCKSPTVLMNLGDPIAPLHHCRFRQPNLKLLSLSAQLERNARQILAAVCSGETLSSPAPSQVDDRRSCNGWHGRAVRQSRVRIPATDSFRAETRNTGLKLCREADCTICIARHAGTD